MLNPQAIEVQRQMMFNIKVFAKKVGKERADNEKEYKQNIDKLETEITTLK
jgi:hypothetical protein